MNWTEPKPPTVYASRYDYVTCDTPLGEAKIEWKSWKDDSSYDLEIGNEWIATAYSLQDAKDMAVRYLTNKLKELSEFLIK